MLPKSPKPFYRKLLIRGATVLFAVEAVGFVGSYFVWNKLNTDRDFRFTIHQKWPLILDFYYKIGETLGDSKFRQIDNEYWATERKLE